MAQQQQQQNQIELAGNKPTLLKFLVGSRESIATALGQNKHLTADKMIKLVTTAVSRTPMLQKCTIESVLKSVMVAAQLGLDCSGVLGSAYMVPYKNTRLNAYEAQLIPGYRGLIDLARRSGEIASIESRVVNHGDIFEYEQGLNPKLRHVPDFDAVEEEPDPDRDPALPPPKFRLVYAIARFTNETFEPQVEVMSLAAILSIRRKSQGFQDYERKLKSGKWEHWMTPPPWVLYFEEMARKTVIRRISKYLPLSVEFQTATEIDDRINNGKPMGNLVDGMLIDQNDGPTLPPPNGTAALGFNRQTTTTTTPAPTNQITTQTAAPTQPQQQTQTPAANSTPAANTTQTSQSIPADSEESGEAIRDGSEQVDEQGDEDSTGANSGSDAGSVNSAQTNEPEKKPVVETPSASPVAISTTSSFDDIIRSIADPASGLTEIRVRKTFRLALDKPWEKMSTNERQALLNKLANKEIKFDGQASAS